MSTDSGVSIGSGVGASYVTGADAALGGTTSKWSWRIIPQIDKDPRLVALAQGWLGRATLIATFAIFLDALTGSPLIAPLAAAVAYADRYRRYVIPAATLLLLYQNGFWVDTDLVARVAEQEGVANQINQPLLFAAMLVLVFAMFFGLLRFWPRVSAIRFFRRSTLCLILLFVGLVLVAQSPIVGGVPRVVVWSFLVTFLPYLWFLAYALADAGARERSPAWQHLGFFHPFWGSTLTPFGKGLSYLRKFEAKTPQELAITQLKGLKLVVWTFFLVIGQKTLTVLIHGILGLPNFDDTFTGYLAGAGFPRYISWASLIAFFAEDVLNMSIWGGVIIACARLAGFRLLRNTYRPMEAASLAEFWNRYYFYYKELLVDHFFYPAFLGYFRSRRKLRMFFATFTAACVGNLLFHCIRDIHFVAEMGLWRALSGEASHAFYTFILAIGVALSQMRPRSVDPSKGWLRRRLFPCLWVALFFCVIHVFDAPLDREHSIWQRGLFLYHLLGMDTWA
jgi:hypothetical protein